MPGIVLQRVVGLGGDEIELVSFKKLCFWKTCYQYITTY